MRARRLAVDLVVDAHQQAIGQARFDEEDDPGPMGLDRLGELHERLDAGTLDFPGPSREMGFSARGVGHRPELIEQRLEPIGFVQRVVFVHEVDQHQPALV